ncbi:YCF48-related protein [Dyadobacter sp. NIV53]|uniref:WD40/YVTN/BNR-like repeat-containing protein n=1 Tax=Dyadobacter sp. NIV53 TaxID=2861765 RepID=UPI001C878210|nr:YCF48-related protein [Dyadobacter sp. NIV53]
MKLTGFFSEIISVLILSSPHISCKETEPTPSNTPISIKNLTELQTNIPPGYYHDLHFVNDSLAFVVGDNNLIVRTRDGGKSWKKLILPIRQSLSLKNVNFFDELNGIAVGSNETEGGVLLTRDGGDTWNIVQEGNIRPNIITLPDSSTGYILTDSKILIKTDDAGVSWTNINLPESALAATVKFKSASEGIVGCARGNTM